MKGIALTCLVLPEAFQVRLVFIVQTKKSGTVKSRNALKIANLLSGIARLEPRLFGPKGPCSRVYNMKGRERRRDTAHS